MAPKVQPQDLTFSLFGVVQVSAVIIASLGALIGFEKVFFPFSGWFWTDLIILRIASI